jgi:molecular chaperone GrpE
MNNAKENEPENKPENKPGNDSGTEPVPAENIEQNVTEIVGECLEKRGDKQEEKKEQHHDKHHKGHEKDEEIKRLKEEIDCLKDSRLRVLAEFDNYKRRTARDSVKLIETANEGLIKDLIPVLENFERALHPDHKNGASEQMLKGIDLIYNMFYTVLKKAGLSEYSPAGEEFDSEKHEAMMHIDSVDVPENKVSQVFQKGYVLNNKVVQYAKVAVSKGNNKPPESK